MCKKMQNCEERYSPKTAPPNTPKSSHMNLAVLIKTNYKKTTQQYHAREPLYLNSAVMVCWLQSMSTQIVVYLAVNKGNILVNILLLKIFIANYYHL